VEKDFDANTKKMLQQMGYKITERGSIGRTEAILINKTGKRETAADKRGDDSVAGY
jgi:gamma-glutamyltranspeptidase/glutathione hydrolase